MSLSNPRPRVALFVTCLVDLFRPSVGFAAVKLLEDAGCEVEVPVAQTCCGQPAFNTGDRATTEELAEIRALKAENRRLREDVEILRGATTFFAGELDPRNR